MAFIQQPLLALLQPTFIANLIILPCRYAADFRILCARNPVPCPLIAESSAVGKFDEVKSWVDGLSGKEVISGLDIRRDAPQYMVYRDSKLVRAGCNDVVEEWTEDHVAFLIGCSFSFESALAEAGLEARHSLVGRNVPMYRTNVPLNPAGVFTSSTYVVSMRPYKRAEIETVRDITRPYVATHGEPIAWGWDAVERLGIKNIDDPEWGAPPLTLEGRPLGEHAGSEDEIPVFWGCGVTPQEAVMKTRRKAYTSAMQILDRGLHQAGLHAGRFQSRPVRQRAHHRSGRPADQGRRGHDRRHLGCRRSRRRQGRSLRQRRPRQDQRSAEVAFRNT